MMHCEYPPPWLPSLNPVQSGAAKITAPANVPGSALIPTPFICDVWPLNPGATPTAAWLDAVPGSSAVDSTPYVCLSATPVTEAEYVLNCAAAPAGIANGRA